MKPNIQNIMHLSTAHITPQTCNLLDASERIAGRDMGSLPCLVFYRKSEFGHFLYIITDDFETEEMKLKQDFPDLWAVVKFALDHNCTLLCLDQDEEPLSELTVYPW